MSTNVNIYNKTYEEYEVRCLLKLVNNKIDINYIRISPKSNLHFSYCIPVKLILGIINKACDKFSHIPELNITSISDLRNMTYDYYLQQPKSLLEWKLNAILAKNTELLKSLNRSQIHPLIRKNQDLL